MGGAICPNVVSRVARLNPTIKEVAREALCFLADAQ